MFWIALAALLSSPQPLNLREWFNFQDVPMSVVTNGPGTWNTAIRADVGPDGQVLSCAVESSSGDRLLDKLSCGLMMRRAKFRSARWSDGSAVFGAYRTSVQWMVSEVPRKVEWTGKPDLDLIVQSLPSGAKVSVVRAMFAVDADGKISSCGGEPSEGLERAKNEPELVPVACAQLLSSYTAAPARDNAGKPIRSVQDAVVRFSVERK